MVEETSGTRRRWTVKRGINQVWCAICTDKCTDRFGRSFYMYSKSANAGCKILSAEHPDKLFSIRVRNDLYQDAQALQL